jgi:hypothetical protein
MKGCDPSFVPRTSNEQQEAKEGFEQAQSDRSQQNFGLNLGRVKGAKSSLIAQLCPCSDSNQAEVIIN